MTTDQPQNNPKHSPGSSQSCPYGSCGSGGWGAEEEAEDISCSTNLLCCCEWLAVRVCSTLNIKQALTHREKLLPPTKTQIKREEIKRWCSFQSSSISLSLSLSLSLSHTHTHTHTPRTTHNGNSEESSIIALNAPNVPNSAPCSSF